MTQDTALILARAHLSFRTRTWHLALLLAALGMGAVMTALLVTEPALPTRTIIAFVVLLVIALAWSLYAAWVLAAQRPLLAYHRVVAGRIAVSAAAIFTVGGALLGLTAGLAVGWATAGLGLLLLAIASFLLRQAMAQHRRLLVRRRELETLCRHDLAIAR